VIFGTSQPAVVARRQVIHELRKRGMAMARIGKHLGGLHHATVAHHLAIPPDPEPERPIEVPRSFIERLNADSGHWAI
jgi:hypothetical protein